MLELGSMTRPLFLTRHDSMQKIASDFPNASHAVLYVREAHPGEAIPAHKTMDDKKAVASLLKDELADPRTILVDGVGGEVHLAYRSVPNAAYIIDKQGVVRFKAPWSNSATTRRALDAVLQDKPATFKSHFMPAKPWVALSTAKRACKGSG